MKNVVQSSMTKIVVVRVVHVVKDVHLAVIKKIIVQSVQTVAVVQNSKYALRFGALYFSILN